MIKLKHERFINELNAVARISPYKVWVIGELRETVNSRLPQNYRHHSTASIGRMIRVAGLRRFQRQNKCCVEFVLLPCEKLL